MKSSACDFLGINADALAAAVLGFKAKNAVNLCKQRIVLTDADVIAGMEMCAALPYEDVARKNELTVPNAWIHFHDRYGSCRRPSYVRKAAN